MENLVKSNTLIIEADINIIIYKFHRLEYPLAWFIVRRHLYIDKAEA